VTNEPIRGYRRRSRAFQDAMAPTGASKDRLDHLAGATARAGARAAAVTQRRRLRAADRLEPRAKRSEADDAG
jgi:hypothetical protein